MVNETSSKTMVRHAAADPFERGLRAFFEYRDLGIAGASGGKVGAHVIRGIPGSHSGGEWHTHDLEFQMVYVLRGWVEFEYEDIGQVRLETGSSVSQAPRVKHREIRHSDDVEMLEITAPAEFPTEMAAPEMAGAA